MPKNIIIVTDGDNTALKAVQKATDNIGARCITFSGGNPTWISGSGLVELIKTTPYDPVVVMVDDCGRHGAGKGEQALAYITEHPDINVLGILAVASNSKNTIGIIPDFCIDRYGEITLNAVDKYGFEKNDFKYLLTGDTVEVLNEINRPVTVGIGDIGKMDGLDDYRLGAPLTTLALEKILERSGFIEPGNCPG